MRKLFWFSAVSFVAFAGSANAESKPDLLLQRTVAEGNVVAVLPAADPVVIRDTRTTNAGPVGAAAPIAASGELLTRQNGVCALTRYKQTKEGLPMPVVESRAFPCDALGNAVQSSTSRSPTVGGTAVSTVHEGSAKPNSACDLDGLLTMNRDGSGVLHCKDHKWSASNS